jgi:hypothetical protein
MNYLPEVPMAPYGETLTTINFLLIYSNITYIMKIVKDTNKKAEIKVPPNSRVPIDTPDNMFEHHNIMLVLGKRQSGKSVFITNYLRMMKDANKADRIVIVSPTVLSNKALLDSLDVEDEDCIDPDDPNCVTKVRDIVDEERDTYVHELDKIARFRELKKIYDGSTIPVEAIDAYTLLEFSDELGNLVEPKLRYGHRPIIHVFFDDCQSSPVFRDKKLLNATIRHRHIGGLPHNPKKHKDLQGAIGASMYFAIQNMKAQGGSCPKAIRNNATQLVIVGKVKDEKELDDVYSSIAGEISKDDFMKGYEYATRERHNSFVIDLHPKKNHPSRFRKNMNEFIVMDDLTQTK